MQGCKVNVSFNAAKFYANIYSYSKSPLDLFCYKTNNQAQSKYFFYNAKRSQQLQSNSTFLFHEQFAVNCHFHISVLSFCLFEQEANFNLLWVNPLTVCQFVSYI